MKYLLSFVCGAFVGAVVALLFAPSSGEELRTKLQAGAETELNKKAPKTPEAEATQAEPAA